jgi:glutamate 5-kinase
MPRPDKLPNGTREQWVIAHAIATGAIAADVLFDVDPEDKEDREPFNNVEYVNKLCDLILGQASRFQIGHLADVCEHVLAASDARLTAVVDAAATPRPVTDVATPQKHAEACLAALADAKVAGTEAIAVAAQMADLPERVNRVTEALSEQHLAAFVDSFAADPVKPSERSLVTHTVRAFADHIRQALGLPAAANS